MNKRTTWLLTLLAATSLILAACPAPAAPANPASEPAVQQAAGEGLAPAPEEPTQVPSQEAPAQPTDSPDAEAPAADDSAPQAAGEAAPAGPQQDPLAVDPNRPGFTYDGSPSLGDPDAPVIIIDFSDFQ